MTSQALISCLMYKLKQTIQNNKIELSFSWLKRCYVVNANLNQLTILIQILSMPEIKLTIKERHSSLIN